MRLLINLLKGFSKIIKSFFNLLLIIGKYPLKLLGFIFKFIAISFYKLYYLLKKYLRQIFPDERIKPIYLFVNKYIIHLIVIILVLIISLSNIFTSETKAESFGSTSILYNLTSDNPEEQYVEEGLVSAEPQISNYLQTGEAVNAPPANQPGSEGGLPISENTGALIKPEIPLGATVPTRDTIIDYVVQNGDTVGTIAQKFGLTQNTLLWENSLTSHSFIKPGQDLKILPTSGVSYKVAKGDTLAKIAQKLNSDTTKIIEFNHLSDQSDIHVGETLIVPEGTPYVPPAPVIKPRIASINQIFKGPEIENTEYLGSGKMLWPNGCHTITQYFNWHHTGVDIACQLGTPIHAAQDGVVYVAEYKTTGYGHSVRIDHGGGVATVYGHMTTLFVTVGESVKRGQVIGLEGSTGHSTGPHLHFEVRLNNKVTNPLAYIK